MAATPARLRIMRDDLINLILRCKLTARAPVALLTARLTLHALLLASSSFAFARASARRC